MSGGRPKYFDTVEELEGSILDYFNNPPTKAVMTKEGLIDVPCLTITGLAYHLGFESRQSFYDYENMPQYSYTIKRARLFIESEYEKLLQVGNTTGAIFALKNFGWKDQSAIDHTTGGDKINLTPKQWLNENEQKV